jgi:histone acetyltransferase (RNA polymerase elongator complex component)
VNNPLFRPPAEAESLILQVDQGCPHNRCTFCGMYRSLAYRRLSMGEVRTLIHLNRMQPRLLSALRVIPVAGTELGEEAAGGKFRPLTEWQAVDELRNILERLDLESTVFRANHASNVVPLEGRLPRDKVRLLAEIRSLPANWTGCRPGPCRSGCSCST